MTRRHRQISLGTLLAALTTLSSACLLDFNDAVPCETQEECPADSYCDSATGRCVVGDSDAVTEDTSVDEDTPITRPDSGTETSDTDTGVTETDTGITDTDTGIVDTDTGVVDTDTGVVDTDTGVVDTDTGVVDTGTDTGTPTECPEDMARIEHSGPAFCIDLWEASRNDATPDSAGSAAAIGPSRANVLPWGGIAFADAEAQCASVGRTLCDDEQWKAACGGEMLGTFPYNRTTYDALACNVGGADDGFATVAPTGALLTCVSPDGPFDMSGNVAEWVGDTRMTRGGGYADSAEFNLRCNRPSGQAVDTSSPPEYVGFRCCLNL